MNLFVLKCFVPDASGPFTKTWGVAYPKPFMDANYLRVRRFEWWARSSHTDIMDLWWQRSYRGGIMGWLEIKVCKLGFVHPSFTLKMTVLNFLGFKIATWFGKMKILFLRNPLQRSGKDFTILKVLPSGVYQYRFIVDGQWRCSPDLPCVQDEAGNTYNILDVKVPFSSQNYLRPFSLKDSIEFQA